VARINVMDEKSSAEEMPEEIDGEGEEGLIRKMNREKWMSPYRR
jgi:hypothetical protein